MNWKTDFDWDGAIKRHSEALKGIIATLFAMLGGEALVSRIPRPFTTPCCSFSGLPNPPCAASSSSRPGALW